MGDGIYYVCYYKNFEDRDLIFGAISADEMCVFVVVVYLVFKIKEEVTVVFIKGDFLEIFGLVESMMTDCVKKTDVLSFWFMSGNFYIGDYIDSCKGYD